jgi:MYXO-CTERM domain-containing protein
MARLFATVARVAEARINNLGRRAALRGSLMACAVLAALFCLGFVLMAATVALAERVGLINALWIMAVGALVLALAFLVALRIEARNHRRTAARRAELDRQLFQAAALSMIPTHAPSRPVLGLGLVAVGALLVLMRRRKD